MRPLHIAQNRRPLPDRLLSLLSPGAEVLLVYPVDERFLFQDRAGTTPVTADGQSVGRILDAGPLGLHLTAVSDPARGVFRRSGRYRWIEFNGVNTLYSTSALPLMTADKAQVIIAARKTDDSTRRMLVEGTGSTGLFGLEAPASASPTFAFGHQGANGSRRTQVASGNAAPATAVLTGLSDFAAPTVAIRVNGVAPAPPAPTATGGGVYNPLGTSPIFLGGRQGSTLLFSGNVYGAPAVRFSTANLGAEVITAGEALLAPEIAGAP